MPALWTPDDIEDRAALLRWVEDRMIPAIQFDRDRSLPVAVSIGERLAAVVVYHQRRGLTVEMSTAADTPRWATRSVIAELLAYPFTVLEVQRITAIVRSDNTRARRFDEGIGFRYEGCMRAAFGEVDAIIYGMTRKDWLASRWHRYRENSLKEAA